MSRKKILISELNLKKIGGRIAFLRIKNGFTLAQLSEKTGISRGNLSGLESNKFDPSVKTIVKLIELFNISADWLLFGKENSEPNSVNKIIIEHQDIVKKFQNSEMAKEINENLLKLESIDFNGFEEIHRIIKMKLEIKELDDRKKTS